ncbi:MAG TPA: FAD-dependent oxidoreductase [Gaiellaceae bacterium]|nr:FAD-dependent oxidoreductase [Gaiellaceae bacterium]
MQATDRYRVLIAGGGVAALEAMVALRTLAGEIVDVELLAPDRDFFYRPLSVTEPFEQTQQLRFDLGALAAGCGASHRLGSLVAVSPDRHVARTKHGHEIAYDALLLALGARQKIALSGALTFGGHRDVRGFTRVLDEIVGGLLASVAFVVPPGVTWPLPLYELALQTATRLGELGGERPQLTVVTIEEEPLGVFGHESGEAVARLLEERGIELQAGVYAERFVDGLVHVVPGEPVPAERAVALPVLAGIPVAGVPVDASGFVHTDELGRVDDLDDVYAAGDGTDFPIKQGGLAAQQAAAAATAIAHAAGAPVEPEKFEPVLRGLLLTGGGPTFLRAELGGGHMYAAEAGEEPLWWPPAKIAARYLGPYLAERAGSAFTPFAVRAG